MWEPLQEDMIRRGWTGFSAPILSTIPIFGPLFYLFARPPLKEDS